MIGVYLRHCMGGGEGNLIGTLPHRPMYEGPCARCPFKKGTMTLRSRMSSLGFG